MRNLIREIFTAKRRTVCQLGTQPLEQNEGVLCRRWDREVFSRHSINCNSGIYIWLAILSSPATSLSWLTTSRWFGTSQLMVYCDISAGTEEYQKSCLGATFVRFIWASGDRFGVAVYTKYTCTGCSLIWGVIAGHYACFLIKIFGKDWQGSKQQGAWLAQQ